MPVQGAEATGAVPDSAGQTPAAIDPTRYGDWVIKGVAIDF
jgi:hypothetical protein